MKILVGEQIDQKIGFFGSNFQNFDFQFFKNYCELAKILSKISQKVHDNASCKVWMPYMVLADTKNCIFGGRKTNIASVHQLMSLTTFRLVSWIALIIGYIRQNTQKKNTTLVFLFNNRMDYKLALKFTPVMHTQNFLAIKLIV